MGADRGVDGTGGLASGVERHRDQPSGQRRDGDQPTCGRVDPGEVGVGAEPAGRSRHLVHEDADDAGGSLQVGPVSGGERQPDRAGPVRPPGREAHEEWLPPSDGLESVLEPIPLPPWSLELPEWSSPGLIEKLSRCWVMESPVPLSATAWPPIAAARTPVVTA